MRRTRWPPPPAAFVDHDVLSARPDSVPGMPAPSAGRRRRLVEELEESGLRLDATDAFCEMLLDEIDHALHPTVHERRVASAGTILEPASDPSGWAAGTQLDITLAPLGGQPLPAARRFTDGLSS